MATQYDQISEALKGFIEAQHMFFVGTAATDGRVNISPKGMDSLRVLGPNRIIWRNLTGSGNETAGHLRDTNRITLMWCGFEKTPMILRVYGQAETLHIDHPDFAKYNDLFTPDPGARQIYDVSVEMVQSSCGYSIPFFDFVDDRRVLEDWSARKGREGIETHWSTKNQVTIDGLPTGTPKRAQ